MKKEHTYKRTLRKLRQLFASHAQVQSEPEQDQVQGKSDDVIAKPQDVSSLIDAEHAQLVVSKSETGQSYVPICQEVYPYNPYGSIRWLQTWLPLVISFFSLLVIIVHTYYYDRQLEAMAKQSELMERQVRQSSDAFAIQERAWIFTEGTWYGILNIKPENKDRAKAALDFRNTGNTPAFNTKVWFCAEIRGHDLPDNITKNEGPSPSCNEFFLGVVGPNTIFHIEQADLERIIDAETSAKLSRKEVHLYIWGVIEYDDFTQQHRFTRFCYVNSDNNKLTTCRNNSGAS